MEPLSRHSSLLPAASKGSKSIACFGKTDIKSDFRHNYVEKRKLQDYYTINILSSTITFPSLLSFGVRIVGVKWEKLSLKDKEKGIQEHSQGTHPMEMVKAVRLG